MDYRNRETERKYEKSLLKKFLSMIKKVNGTNIVLQYKFDWVFYGEHFYI